MTCDSGAGAIMTLFPLFPKRRPPARSGFKPRTGHTTAARTVRGLNPDREPGTTATGGSTKHYHPMSSSLQLFVQRNSADGSRGEYPSIALFLKAQVSLSFFLLLVSIS